MHTRPVTVDGNSISAASAVATAGDKLLGQYPDFAEKQFAPFPQTPCCPAPSPPIYGDTSGKVEYQTGAVRSADAEGVRFDLLSPIALTAYAKAAAEGAAKYPPHNWLNGFPASSLLNHLQRHLQLWSLGDRTEDHLGHALWNLATLIHFDAVRPDLMDLPPYDVSKDTLYKLREDFKTL